MLEFGGFWRWFAHLFERWPPGVPPDPKKCENVSIFDPKTDIFQVKKAGIPSCFLNIFGKKTNGTVQTKTARTRLQGTTMPNAWKQKYVEPICFSQRCNVLKTK